MNKKDNENANSLSWVEFHCRFGRGSPYLWIHFHLSTFLLFLAFKRHLLGSDAEQQRQQLYSLWWILYVNRNKDDDFNFDYISCQSCLVHVLACQLSACVYLFLIFRINLRRKMLSFEIHIISVVNYANILWVVLSLVISEKCRDFKSALWNIHAWAAHPFVY